jgi:hypothetical protein
VTDSQLSRNLVDIAAFGAGVLVGSFDAVTLPIQCEWYLNYVEKLAEVIRERQSAS